MDEKTLRDQITAQRQAVENAQSGWQHASPHFEAAAWALLRAEEMKLDALYMYAKGWIKFA